jgi:aldose 1-epimerase
LAGLTVTAVVFTALTNPLSAAESKAKMVVEKSVFGQTPEGHTIHAFTCTNSQGSVLKLIDYGAHVISVEVPDRSGQRKNVTLGFDDAEGYLRRHPYFGSTVGRYCNRIAKGKFLLGGRQYSLATNNAPNHLHGGERGFDRFMWTAEEISDGKQVGVRFTRTSPDGEEGYPGTVRVSATYTLNAKDELTMEFSATTDKATPINLTNHAYWNLSGDAKNILDHELTIESDKFLTVDSTLIPTGELVDVVGTPLDFTRPRKIGERIREIKSDPVGYDHCFVLRSQDGTLKLAAKAKDPKTGRVMEVWTTQPGVQFYTGNFLDGSETAGGFGQYSAFCLETQHYPDSPNQPSFPSTILKPGETLRQTTVHRFYAE